MVEITVAVVSGDGVRFGGDQEGECGNLSGAMETFSLGLGGGYTGAFPLIKDVWRRAVLNDEFQGRRMDGLNGNDLGRWKLESPRRRREDGWGEAGPRPSPQGHVAEERIHL